MGPGFESPPGHQLRNSHHRSVSGFAENCTLVGISSLSTATRFAGLAAEGERGNARGRKIDFNRLLQEKPLNRTVWRFFCFEWYPAAFLVTWRVLRSMLSSARLPPAFRILLTSGLAIRTVFLFWFYICNQCGYICKNSLKAIYIQGIRLYA